MIKKTAQAHEIFAALGQEYQSQKWSRQDPLLSRQIRLNQAILAVFAIRKYDGRHILFIECDPEDAVDGYKYPDWKGISIQYSGFENPGMGGCFIRIEQMEGSDEEIYFAVTEDLCSCLASAEKQHLRKMLSSSLERWKRFFSLRESIKLSKEEQIGLFGELWLMRRLLQNNLGSQAVRYWKGPYREVFDFSIPNMSIEVKTTAAKTPYKAYISNEMQLDERLAGGTLIMCFIAVQSSDSSGDTLGDMVKFIDEFLKGNEEAYGLFRDKIFGCGLGDAYINDYKTKYIVKEFAFFNIKEGFPRILSKNLPNGLGDISYSIDISACSIFKLDEAEIWQTANRYAGGESA
jgi:hypothetical protein